MKKSEAERSEFHGNSTAMPWIAKEMLCTRYMADDVKESSVV